MCEHCIHILSITVKKHMHLSWKIKDIEDVSVHFKYLKGSHREQRRDLFSFVRWTRQGLLSEDAQASSLDPRRQWFVYLGQLRGSGYVPGTQFQCEYHRDLERDIWACGPTANLCKKSSVCVVPDDAERTRCGANKKRQGSFPFKACCLFRNADE